MMENMDIIFVLVDPHHLGPRMPMKSEGSYKLIKQNSRSPTHSVKILMVTLLETLPPLTIVCSSSFKKNRSVLYKVGPLCLYQLNKWSYIITPY